MITFRIGPEDAELFEKEFAPEFIAEDLVNLGFSQIYLRLMIDGIGSKPFSATTMPPISLPENSFKEKIIEETRKVYATPRSEVEGAVNKWYEPVPSSKPPREKKRAGMGAFGAREEGFSASPRPPRVEMESRREERREPPRPHEKTHDGHRDIQRRERPFSPKIEPRETRMAETKKADPVHLSELKPNAQKGPSSNATALKEVLAAALKEKGDVPAKAETERKNEAPGNNLAKNAPENGLKEESKKWEEIKKNDQAPSAPKEVPEDVLKKLLSE